jgi:hypothetical protein
MVPVIGALWVCAAVGVAARPVSSNMLARRARSVGCMVGFFQKLEIFCCGVAVFHRMRGIGYIKGDGGYRRFLAVTKAFGPRKGSVGINSVGRGLHTGWIC